MNTKEKFWSEVNIKNINECWPFKRGKHSNGYGRFYASKDKGYLAHRFAWSLINGPIPEGMYILHKCDNPPCCNPSHLYCGTLVENRRDSGNRHPVSAEISGRYNAKLYSGEIWLIRKLRFVSTATYIAKMFKVSRKTISNIWKSERWLCKEGYYI